MEEARKGREMLEDNIRQLTERCQELTKGDQQLKEKSRIDIEKEIKEKEKGNSKRLESDIVEYKKLLANEKEKYAKLVVKYKKLEEDKLVNKEQEPVMMQNDEMLKKRTSEQKKKTHKDVRKPGVRVYVDKERSSRRRSRTESLDSEASDEAPAKVKKAETKEKEKRKKSRKSEKIPEVAKEPKSTEDKNEVDKNPKEKETDSLKVVKNIELKEAEEMPAKKVSDAAKESVDSELPNTSSPPETEKHDVPSPEAEKEVTCATCGESFTDQEMKKHVVQCSEPPPELRLPDDLSGLDDDDDDSIKMETDDEDIPEKTPMEAPDAVLEVAAPITTPMVESDEEPANEFTGKPMSLYRALGGGETSEEEEDEEILDIVQGSETCPSCQSVLSVSKQAFVLDMSNFSFLLECGQCGTRLRLQDVLGEHEQNMLSCGM